MARSVRGTKIPRAPRRRRNGGAVLRAKFFFWWFDNSRSQSSQWNLWISKQSSICSRGAGLRHPMDPVVSVQNKNFRKHREAWSQIGSLKSFPLRILWNLAKFVKIFLGIIVRRHHTDQKQMGLLTEQCAEQRKAFLPYCCNQVWMKIGGQIPWNALFICETFKISYLMGRLLMRDLVVKPFKGRIIPFGSSVEYYLISAKDQSRIQNFAKKVLPELFFGYVLCAEGFGRVTCWLQTLMSWKRWTHQKSTLKDPMQRK